MVDTTSNNKIVQTFALKLGALNLTQKIKREQDSELQEAFFSSLFSFLKGENTEGKRLFIREYAGIALLKELILKDLTRTFLRQLLQLLYDLLKEDA